MLPKQTSSLSALVVNATGNVATPSATSASSTSSAANPGIAGKLVALVVACLLLSAFLIMTNLWPVVVILLAIPQVRTVVVTQGKAKLRTLLDQAATG